MSVTPRLLGATALLLAGLAAVAGARPGSGADPASLRRLAAEIESHRGEISPLQLADSIRSRTPGLQVIDLRPAAEFATGHIPTAQRRAVTDLPDLASGGGTLVVYGSGDDAAAAWLLMRALGHAHVWYLPRGFEAWQGGVLRAVLDRDSLPPGEFRRLADLSRYFGGSPTVGKGTDAVTGAARPTAATSIQGRSGGC